MKTGEGKLTHKQKVFARQYALTGEKTSSAKIAYPAVASDQAAYNLAAQNLRNSKVITYISNILDNSGLSVDKLAGFTGRVIKAGINRKNISKATPSDSLRGIEMIVDKRTLSVNYDVKTDEELLQALNDITQQAKQYQDLITSKTKQ
jgi:inosine/xanthosine triphosphate pyrophosphatase family protein